MLILNTFFQLAKLSQLFHCLVNLQSLLKMVASFKEAKMFLFCAFGEFVVYHFFWSKLVSNSRNRNNYQVTINQSYYLQTWMDIPRCLSVQKSSWVPTHFSVKNVGSYASAIPTYVDVGNTDDDKMLTLKLGWQYQFISSNKRDAGGSQKSEKRWR